MIIDGKTPAAIGRATRVLVEEYLSAHPGYRWRDELLDQLERFAVELALWGTKFNLTAAPDDPAAIAFHIADSLMPIMVAAGEPSSLLASAFRTGNRVLDLGSGAGFPGLILAAATDAEFVLTESRRRRASFLRAAAVAMKLDNVQIDSRHRDSFTPEFEVVTARAFAQPTVFYVTAATAIKPDGLTILYASVRQRDEISRILAGWAPVVEWYEYDPLRAPNQDADSKAVPHHLIVVSSCKS